MPRAGASSFAIELFESTLRAGPPWGRISQRLHAMARRNPERCTGQDGAAVQKMFRE